MSEIEELLQGVRAESHQAGDRRGGRVVMALAGTAAIVTLCSMGVFAVAATTTLVSAEATTEAASAVAEPAVKNVVATETQPVAAAAPAPATADPAFGASTDPADVPMPDGVSGDELANARIWVEQQVITANCMQDQGFEYTFTPSWLRASHENLTSPVPLFTPAWTALVGNTGGGEDYNWEDAGCQGYAVHITGMDDAN